MIIDSQLLFSDAQAITAAAASTSSVDLGSARDIGLGENLYVAVTVDVAFTDAGSDSTLTVALESDDNAGFASPTSATLLTIPALAAVGAKFFARISPDQANQRYIQLRFTPNNGNLTTGSVTAAIVKDIDKVVTYPKGYVISP
jgi:hypothetical protein